MEPLDKLEMIIIGERDELEAELKIYRANEGPYSTSHFTIDRLENKIDALSWVWVELDWIRSNDPSVSDAIVKKMYGKS